MRVRIPLRRRARYAHLADAIIEQLLEPTRARIEAQMQERTEAVERAYYRAQGYDV